MVKKAVLAQFIAQGRHDVSEWHSFLPKVTGLRVKGVGSEGAVLISLDDSGWFTPGDWLANYRTTVSERLAQELKTAEAVLPPEKMEALLLQYATPQDKITLDAMDRGYMLQLAGRNTETVPQRLLNCLTYVLKKFDQAIVADEVKQVIQYTPYVKPTDKR